MVLPSLPNGAIAPMQLRYHWTPIASVVPFTYRDGWTMLKLIEEFRKYITETFHPDLVRWVGEELDQIKANIDALGDQLVGQQQVFIDQITALVAEINNRVGPTDVKHLTVGQNVVIDPVWPNNHVIWYEYVQGAAGGGAPTLPANVTGNPHINVEPNAVTRFMLWPDGGGNYVAINPWWEEKLVFNVREYGAKGDGATDDSEAVRKAAEMCKPSGGTIYFPAGDYVVNSAVEIYSNTTITGSGATIRKTNNSYSLFYSLARDKTGYSSGAVNVRIHGLTFKGDLINGYTMSAYSSHRGGSISVWACTFDECARSGHVLDLQGCEDVKVWGNTFRGIDATAGRQYVEAIQIDSSSANGVGFPGEMLSGEVFDGTPTRNVRVWGNYFGPTTRAGKTWPAQCPIGSHSYVDGKPYLGIVFEGNIVEGVVSVEGASYTGVIHFVGARGVRVRNNRFVAGGKANSVFRAMGGGLATMFGDVGNRESVIATATNPVQCDDVLFEGNYCEGFHSAGATVWIYGTETLRISEFAVNRNKFVNCQGNAGDGAAVRGTFVDSVTSSYNTHIGGGSQHWFGWCNKVEYAGNYSLNSLSQAFYATSCQDVEMCNNKHYSAASGPVISNCAGVRVMGNRLHTTGTGHGLQINGTPTFPSPMICSDNFVTMVGTPEADARPIFTNVTNYARGLAVNNVGEKYTLPSLFAAAITTANNINV